ncbi:MAG TPA: hypothetical protein VG621_01075 [Candidatus Paceibacterota bacterium]|nr:hypothetical protein [Candidatus Paceibacterota bacterium]
MDDERDVHENTDTPIPDEVFTGEDEIDPEQNAGEEEEGDAMGLLDDDGRDPYAADDDEELEIEQLMDPYGLMSDY